MALNSLKMNLDYIRTFVVLGQSRNMTETAKKLSVTVSYVSRHIKALEDELQVKLLIPIAKNKDLQLTDAGKYFFEKYEKIYNEILLAEKEYQQTKQLDSCKITIGFSSGLEDSVIKPIISEYSKQFPNICIKMISDETETLSKKLLQYAIDIVIDKKTPVNNSKLQDIETRNLFSTNYCFAYNKNYFEDIKDITNQPLILPVSIKSDRALINEYFVKNNITPFVKYEVENYDRTLSYVKDGLGIGLFLKENVINEKDIGIIDIDLKADINVSFIKEQLTPSTKEFIKLLGIEL